jgi:hypothetical protein
MFERYALSRRTRPEDERRAIPESPVYAKQSGYQTLTKTLGPENRTFQMLDVLRKLTITFLDSAQPQHEKACLPPSLYLQQLSHQVFAFLDAQDIDFGTMSERYTYEAVRITSHIYAHAVTNRVSFSEAAIYLQRTENYKTLQPGYLSRNAPYMENCCMHIHIRNLLMRTDTSDCWGQMVGVLFWVALIAGASANPAAWPGGYVPRRESGEEEEARKWLAAVVVRCSIILGFEFGSPVLETLKRVMAVQQAIVVMSDRADSPHDSLTASDTVDQHNNACSRTAETSRQSFSDFATDFLSA